MIQRLGICVKLLDGGLVYGLVPPHRFGHVFNELSRGVAQGGGAVEHRGGEGVIQVIQKQLCRVDLYLVVRVVIFPSSGEVILILRVLLSLGGHRHVTLGLGVGYLYRVSEQVLSEQPRGQHFLGILFVEDADGGPLGDHLGVVGVELRDLHDHRLKVHDLLFSDIHQGGVAAHPGGTGSGVDGEYALTGVQEVGGIAGDLEGGEGSGGSVVGDAQQQVGSGVIEELNISRLRGIPRVQLTEHLDHHVVGGFVNEGDQHLLTVEGIGPIVSQCSGRCFADFPDEIPGQGLRKCIAQSLYKVFVNITRLGGPHVGHAVIGAAQLAFL